MKFSIVIPAIGCQADIDATLVSVLENRPTSSEVLLVHPSSYVDPYQLDDEIRLVCSQASSLISLLNQGFEASQRDVICTLSPGVVVEEGWSELAMERFEDDQNLASVSPRLYVGKSKTPVRGIGFRASTGRQTIRRAGERVIAPTIAAGFYLRSAVRFMKGFHEPFGRLADVDLGLRFAMANYRCKAADIRLRVRQMPSEQFSGYQAGYVRGRLCQMAKQVGMASAAQSMIATLTEPIRNGIGPGLVTGIAGRVAASLSKPATNVISSSKSDGRERRAAA